MTEHRLTAEDVPYVSTAAFHADRPRAPHLEQEGHRPRLERAADFIRQAFAELDSLATLSDLGCGDGGLLSLVQGLPGLDAWGYDFQPTNAAGWKERGVRAWQRDVFGADRQRSVLGDIVVMTEVLEHIAEPLTALGWARAAGAQRLVCSSPWNEGPGNHCPEHAWAWDTEGYANMISRAGWEIERHEQVGLFQVVLAR